MEHLKGKRMEKAKQSKLLLLTDSMYSVSTAILILVLSVGSLGDAPGSNCTCNTGTPGDTTADQLKLKQGLNQFSIDLFKTLAADKPDENLILSPFSIALPFFQLLMYSKGATLTQMQTTLGVESINQLRRAIRPVLNSMKGGGGVILDVANKMFVNKKFSISDGFNSDSNCLLNATAEPLDFTQPDASAKKINKFVADNTDNKITNLIQADVITPMTRLILVNAIYMKGTWKNQFNINQTQKMVFHSGDNKTTEVQMMYMKAKLNYTYVSELKAKVVVLDYENPDFKYFVMLPDAINGLAEMLSKLNATIMDNIMSSYRETQVKLWLPRYKVNLGFSLVKYLSSMGMTDIFSSRNAQLRGLLKQDQDLYVSEGIHKACIEVDEKGTTAAAATAVIVSNRATVKPFEVVVKADHPYLYFLVHNRTIIFSGSLSKN